MLRYRCHIFFYLAYMRNIKLRHLVSCIRSAGFHGKCVNQLQHHAASCSVMQHHAASCSVMQRHAASCSVMQCKKSISGWNNDRSLNWSYLADAGNAIPTAATLRRTVNKRAHVSWKGPTVLSSFTFNKLVFVHMRKWCDGVPTEPEGENTTATASTSRRQTHTRSTYRRSYVTACGLQGRRGHCGES